MEDKTEKLMEVRFDTLSKLDSISLTGRLWAFDSHSEWEFNLYQHDTRQFVLQNTSLNELIELILLGKLHKAQLQAMDKKEPVVKCDLCGNPAEWFESPLGNLDEPKMCNQHYRKYVEPGARDWDAHHITPKCETEIRELQNNG